MMQRHVIIFYHYCHTKKLQIGLKPIGSAGFNSPGLKPRAIDENPLPVGFSPTLSDNNDFLYWID